MSAVTKATVLEAVERAFAPDYRAEAKAIVEAASDTVISVLSERYADASISAYGGGGPSTEELSVAVAAHLYETSE